MTAIPKMVDIGAYDMPDDLVDAVREVCRISKKYDCLMLGITTLGGELDHVFISRYDEKQGHNVHFSNGTWQEYEWRDGVSDE